LTLSLRVVLQLRIFRETNGKKRKPEDSLSISARLLDAISIAACGTEAFEVRSPGRHARGIVIPDGPERRVFVKTGSVLWVSFAGSRWRRAAAVDRWLAKKTQKGRSTLLTNGTPVF